MRTVEEEEENGMQWADRSKV